MKNLAILIAFIVVSGIVGFAFTQLGGQTSIPNPLITSPISPTPGQSEKCEALKVVSPEESAKVKSPLRINAIVDNSDPDCRWTVFEAAAGAIEIKDEEGNVLGSGVLSTNEEWMTEKPVSYSAEVEFKASSGDKLLLVVTEENPSGKNSPQAQTIPLSY